jgi:putative alpha-1,2-mannosidase
VKLNGQVFEKDFINYNQIMKGGKLDIYLQEKPDKNWANSPKTNPEDYQIE